MPRTYSNSAMAVPHPLPIPVNVHPVPGPAHPQQFVMQQQGGPSMPVGMQGYPHPYAIRPPPQNMNGIAMSSQQAAALHEQQQQRIRLSQQQQIAANHAAVAQQQAAQQVAHQQAAQAAQAVAQQNAQAQQQPRAVPAPSPHIPNPSPHLAHQFPPGHPAHYQQHPQSGPPGVPLPPGAPGGGMSTPQPPGVGGPSPAVAMRQPPHPQARPPAHGFQQHPGMQPGQHMAQPMVHTGSQQGHGPPPPQPPNGGHLQPIPEGDFAMARGGSGPPRQWDLDGLLKLYIFDYLVKNNFGQLAAQFNAEARLENQGAPVNVPEGGALQEWWTIFWDVFSGGKGAQGASTVPGYTESLRNQQFGFPANYGQFPPGQQPQQIPGQQVLGFRPQAPGQPNGMLPAQMMQQQLQQQQVNQQQQAAQTVLMQQQAQQRFAAAGGPSTAPAQRPPAGHPMYGQHMVPPNAQPGPPHSPLAPSPHMMQAPHPVMPSPHQRKMTGPQMNGPPGAGGPVMRAGTPQNGPPPPPGAPQFGAPGVPPSPAPGQPMTPQMQQQHQQQQIMQAHAQAMQQRAQASLAEVQQAQMHAAAQNQHAAQMQNQAHHQQLQAMQAHQAQQAANSMYQGLGLGQVNPNIMQASANSLGLGGRAVDTMGEEDRNRLIQQYRLTMQENQRRQMHNVNGGAMPSQQQMMQAQIMQAQQQQHAQAQAQAHAVQAAQQAQMQQQAQQMQQTQSKGPSRNGTGQFEQGTPMQQTESGRGASPQEGGTRGTKRARRNSGGSAAPSPFIQGGPTPGYVASTPQQVQTPQMQPLGTPNQIANQHSQQQQAMAMAQMQADAAAQNNRAQAARTLGPNGSAQFAPHTPNASESPAQGAPGQSPRNATGLNMQRNQSKGGAMLPPQSPATTLQRSTTPKPSVTNKTPNATPKSARDESMREAATPKSLNPSPNNVILSVPATESAPNSTGAQGLTPSPPSGDPISTAPTSVPPLSAGSNGALSFNTDIQTDSGMDNSLFELGGDFDFASLMGPNGDGFDFNMYLQYEGDDNGEVAVAP